MCLCRVLKSRFAANFSEPEFITQTAFGNGRGHTKSWARDFHSYCHIGHTLRLSKKTYVECRCSEATCHSGMSVRLAMLSRRSWKLRSAEHNVSSLCAWVMDLSASFLVIINRCDLN